MILKAIKKLIGFAFSSLSSLVIILLCFGGIIGVVIEAKQGDVIGIVLSLLVPGYGGYLAIVELMKYFGI